MTLPQFAEAYLPHALAIIALGLSALATYYTRKATKHSDRSAAAAEKANDFAARSAAAAEEANRHAREERDNDRAERAKASEEATRQALIERYQQCAAEAERLLLKLRAYKAYGHSDKPKELLLHSAKMLENEVEMLMRDWSAIATTDKHRLTSKNADDAEARVRDLRIAAAKFDERPPR